jgi:hypothetical protein
MDQEIAGIVVPRPLGMFSAVEFNVLVLQVF